MLNLFTRIADIIITDGSVTTSSPALLDREILMYENYDLKNMITLVKVEEFENYYEKRTMMNRKQNLL